MDLIIHLSFYLTLYLDVADEIMFISIFHYLDSFLGFTVSASHFVSGSLIYFVRLCRYLVCFHLLVFNDISDFNDFSTSMKKKYKKGKNIMNTGTNFGADPVGELQKAQ